MGRHTRGLTETKQAPHKLFKKQELVTYRCHECRQKQEVETSDLKASGDDFSFYCWRCGALLGPAGSHPGRKEIIRRDGKSGTRAKSKLISWYNNSLQYVIRHEATEY